MPVCFDKRNLERIWWRLSFTNLLLTHSQLAIAKALHNSAEINHFCVLKLLCATCAISRDKGCPAITISFNHSSQGPGSEYGHGTGRLNPDGCKRDGSNRWQAGTLSLTPLYQSRIRAHGEISLRCSSFPQVTPRWLSVFAEKFENCMPLLPCLCTRAHSCCSPLQLRCC
jgi:hypothetical protein